MQAAGLKFFIEEIRKEDSAFSSDVLAWTVYVKMREHWAQEGQQPLEEKNLSQTFDHLLSTGKYSCPPRSRRAYFPIQPLSLILGADFQSRPRSRTQQRISNALRRALKHAQDAFNANHDVLTGAPNRVAFEKKLAEAIDTSFAGIDGSSDTLTAAEVISPSTLALVALDIDHFKQLNDTFGHLYGDVVLQVFVRRLERHLARLEQQFADRLHTSFARLGGEEFGILVLGRLTSNDLKQVAEEIRSSIAEVPLPTDEEWTALEQATPVSSLSLPHIADRRVTISVGVAVLPPAVTTEGSSALSSHLRSNADAALFRAKAGGRNTVRHYSEILDRHGRTLQHHSATGLVAIDIGRAVGVVVGQEFTVFHPDFVGDKPFLYDDGRTQKRLGKYPRHPCARLLVIDAQQEISFCRLISTDLSTPIPPGSHLELVPVGSIAHLLAPDLKLELLDASVLTPPEQLPKIIQDMAAVASPLQTAVVGLDDVEKLAKERGTAFVNSALANLYRALREEFPIHKAIAQILPTQFAIVLSDPNPSEMLTEFLTVVRTASDKSAGLASFRAGLYLSNTNTEPIKGDSSVLRSEHALEYARFAISPQEPDQGPVCIFNPIVAYRVIAAWRNKQRYREAIADYHNLRQIGVEYSSAENLAALSAFSLGESQKTVAMEAVARAVKLDPDNPTLKANQAFIETAFGDRVHAWQLFSELPSNYTPINVYLPRRALALAAAYSANPESFSADAVEKSIKEVLSLDSSVLSRSIRNELQTFLDRLTTTQAKPG